MKREDDKTGIIGQWEELLWHAVRRWETKEKDLDKDPKDRKSTEKKELIAYTTKKNFSQRKRKKNKDKRKTDIQTQWP